MWDETEQDNEGKTMPKSEEELQQPSWEEECIDNIVFCCFEVGRMGAMKNDIMYFDFWSDSELLSEIDVFG